MKTARVTVVLLVLALGIFELAAGNPWEYERWYYTDATKTTQCGYKSVWCNGSYATGCVTSYHNTEYIWPCGGGSCEDGYDNDHDGMTDYGDPSCFTWNLEVNQPG